MTRLKSLLIFLLIIPSILVQLSAQDNKYDNEFYKALNSLVNSKYPKISLIIDSTWNVYTTPYGEHSIPKQTEDPPPPPVPGIIYYDRWTFKYLVISERLDSNDIDGMYKSIDSTKNFIIDQNKMGLRVIPWDKVSISLRNQDGDFTDDEIEKTYGARNFIIVSTPIFNADYTSLVITIKQHHGDEDLSGIMYVMRKRGESWKIAKGSKVIKTKI
jgi:hypothetical protein